ncbi:10261_t:CDS:2, partial [Gigaspora margarita]
VQPSSSHNESRTRHASRSIEYHNESLRKLGNNIQEIKDELKHLRGDPEKDLSTKVLDDVYTNFVKCLFPNHLYPCQRELKETIKEYMNENFPEFVRNI